MDEKRSTDEETAQSLEPKIWPPPPTQYLPMPTEAQSSITKTLPYILYGLAGVMALIGMFYGLAFIGRADTDEEYQQLHGALRLSLLAWGTTSALFLTANLILTKSWLGRVFWVVFIAIVWLFLYPAFAMRMSSSH